MITHRREKFCFLVLPSVLGKPIRTISTDGNRVSFGGKLHGLESAFFGGNRYGQRTACDTSGTAFK